jgi:hypothetical protein
LIILIKPQKERDIIGFDEKTNRLLYFANEADLEDSVKLKPSIIQK